MASAVAPVPFALSALPRPVKRVLLVDESPKDLQANADTLNGQGYTIQMCESVARESLV